MRCSPAAGAKRVELPTYAFQRERYWLALDGWCGRRGWHRPGACRRASAAGRGGGAGRRRGLAVHRPAVAARPTRGWPTTRCWAGAAAGHGVPGAGAARRPARSAARCVRGADAGGAAGARAEHGRCSCRSRSASRTSDGRRQVEHLLARADATVGWPEEGRRAWTRHASGHAGRVERGCERAGASACAELGVGEWPPAGCEELDVECPLRPAGAAGLGLRPGVPGRAAAWRGDGEVFAEVDAAREAGCEEASASASTPRCSTRRCTPRLLELAARNCAGGRAAVLLGGVSSARDGRSALRVRLTRGEGARWPGRVDDAGEPASTMGSIRGPPARGAAAGAGRIVAATTRCIGWNGSRRRSRPVAGGQPRRFALLGDLRAGGPRRRAPCESWGVDRGDRGWRTGARGGVRHGAGASTPVRTPRSGSPARGRSERSGAPISVGDARSRMWRWRRARGTRAGARVAAGMARRPSWPMLAAGAPHTRRGRGRRGAGARPRQRRCGAWCALRSPSIPGASCWSTATRSARPTARPAAAAGWGCWRPGSRSWRCVAAGARAAVGGAGTVAEGPGGRAGGWAAWRLLAPAVAGIASRTARSTWRWSRARAT